MLGYLDTSYGGRDVELLDGAVEELEGGDVEPLEISQSKAYVGSIGLTYASQGYESQRCHRPSLLLSPVEPR